MVNTGALFAGSRLPSINARLAIVELVNFVYFVVWLKTNMHTHTLMQGSPATWPVVQPLLFIAC